VPTFKTKCSAEVKEIASGLFNSLAILDVRYFVDKNAKTNKSRENILSSNVSIGDP
jgi:hypothetical protein